MPTPTRSGSQSRKPGAQPKKEYLPYLSTTLGRYNLQALQSGGGSCAVDMGGMFVHGIEGNPVYSLVKDAGINSAPWDSTILYDNQVSMKQCFVKQ